MIPSTVHGRVLTADRMQAHNTFDAPEQVRPIEFQSTEIEANQMTITLPAMSVVVLELN